MIAPADQMKVYNYPQFNEELFAIQQEFSSPKDKTNNFGKYKYRNAESMLEALKPLLSKYKATLRITEKAIVLGKEQVMKEYVMGKFQLCEKTEIAIQSIAIFTSKSGTVTARAFAGIDTNKKGMDYPQAYGSASSYAKKYVLQNIFAVDDSKDDPDANNDHGMKAQIPSIESLRTEFITLAEKSTDEKVTACIAKIECFTENQLSIMIKKLRGV